MKVEMILTIKYRGFYSYMYVCHPNLQMKYYYWNEALLELSVLCENTAWWTQPGLAHSWNGLKPTDQLATRLLLFQDIVAVEQLENRTLWRDIM